MHGRRGDLGVLSQLLTSSYDGSRYLATLLVVRHLRADHHRRRRVSRAAESLGLNWLTRSFVSWYGAAGIDEDQATYGELHIGTRYDDLLIQVTGVGEYTWGDAVKQEALAKLKEMSENCEISPAVAVKLRLTEEFYDHLFILAAGEE